MTGAERQVDWAGCVGGLGEVHLCWEIARHGLERVEVVVGVSRRSAVPDSEWSGTGPGPGYKMPGFEPLLDDEGPLGDGVGGDGSAYRILDPIGVMLRQAVAATLPRTVGSAGTLFEGSATRWPDAEAAGDSSGRFGDAVRQRLTVTVEIDRGHRTAKVVDTVESRLRRTLQDLASASERRGREQEREAREVREAR